MLRVYRRRSCSAFVILPQKMLNIPEKSLAPLDGSQFAEGTLPHVDRQNRNKHCWCRANLPPQ